MQNFEACLVDDAVMHVECRGAAVSISTRYSSHCTWRSNNTRSSRVCATGLIQGEGDFFVLNTQVRIVYTSDWSCIFTVTSLMSGCKTHLLLIETVKEIWEMSEYTNLPRLTSNFSSSIHWLQKELTLTGYWLTEMIAWNLKVFCVLIECKKSEEHHEHGPDHHGATNMSLTIASTKHFLHYLPLLVHCASSNKDLRHSAKEDTWLTIKSGCALLTCIWMTPTSDTCKKPIFRHGETVYVCTLSSQWFDNYDQSTSLRSLSKRRFRNKKVEIHVCSWKKVKNYNLW